MNERLPQATPHKSDASDRRATLTISIVSHRHMRDCAQLIDDLVRINPPDLARVILTLNVPEDVPVLRELPFELSVIRNREPMGFAANHNAAFELVTTEYFAVLNPDLRIARDPFPALLSRAADERVAVTSPVILESSGNKADFERKLVSPWDIVRRRFATVERRNKPRPPQWLAGVFFVFRSDIYRRLGGFHAGYRLYCEDADLCARARLQGLLLEVAHEVSVVHRARRASHRSPVHLRLHLSSLVKFWTSAVYRQYRELLRAESRGYVRASNSR